MVEQRTENPRVIGSIPILGTLHSNRMYGILAQSVEHLTFNQGVGGSNPPCLMNLNIVEDLRCFFYVLIIIFIKIVLILKYYIAL